MNFPSALVALVRLIRLRCRCRCLSKRDPLTSPPLSYTCSKFQTKREREREEGAKHRLEARLGFSTRETQYSGALPIPVFFHLPSRNVTDVGCNVGHELARWN